VLLQLGVKIAILDRSNRPVYTVSRMPCVESYLNSRFSRLVGERAQLLELASAEVLGVLGAR
jgi:hypothetical protein